MMNKFILLPLLMILSGPTLCFAEGPCGPSAIVQNLELQEIVNSSEDPPVSVTLGGQSYELGRNISGKKVSHPHQDSTVVDGYKNDLYVSPNRQYYFLQSYNSHEWATQVNDEGFGADVTKDMTFRLFHGPTLEWSVSVPDGEDVAWNPDRVFNNGGVLMEGIQPRNSDLEGGGEAQWYRVYDAHGKKIFETNRKDHGVEFVGSNQDCAVFSEETYEGDKTTKKILAVNLIDGRKITFDVSNGEYFTYLAPDMNYVLIHNGSGQHMMDTQGKVKWVLAEDDHMSFIRPLCGGKILAFQELDPLPQDVGKGSKRIVYYDAETGKPVKSVYLPLVAKSPGDYYMNLIDLANDGSLAIFRMDYEIVRSFATGSVRPLESRIGIMNFDGKLVAAFDSQGNSWKFSDDVGALLLNDYRGDGNLNRKPLKRFKLIKRTSD